MGHRLDGVASRDEPIGLIHGRLRHPFFPSTKSAGMAQDQSLNWAGTKSSNPLCSSGESAAKRRIDVPPAAVRWDRRFESGSLQQRVCKLSVPHESSCGSKQSEASRISTRGWDRGFESPLLQRRVRNELLIDATPFAGSASLT
jgi:hypothetical protein